MKNPTLIVMAAGMGSRYGGLKQMDPVGSQGELILDFSIHDAILAGFEKVIFVIKKEMEKDFAELLEKRPGRKIETSFAFQQIEDLPAPFVVPTGREKPWGTCHAVMSCRKQIEGPFAVINADDYYGREAFQKMADYLRVAKDDEKMRYSMIGYSLENTLTENGHVARGVCSVSEEGFLTEINERTKIMEKDGAIKFEKEDGSWEAVPRGTAVSMNFWGFTESFMEELFSGFPKFLEKALIDNPLKAEYFLPLAIDNLLKEGRASVKVLPCADKWFGVTYKEDKEGVVAALREMKKEGKYPEYLWDRE